MIRINLAKTHSYGATGTQAAAVEKANAGSSGIGQPHPGLKIAAMLLATLCLYIYESYNIGQKEATLVSVNAQLQEIQKEAQKMGTVKTVVEGLIDEKKRLAEQLEVIEKISKKRAFKLKAIRKVQESVLEDLWLKELEVDQNEIIFKGISRTPTSVQQIVRTLNNSDFIESAINRQLTKTTYKGDNVNSFDIRAQVKD